MEFIKAEEFLGQPIEVQKVLLEWWKENVKQYDLFYRNFKGERQKYIVIKSEGYELETLTLRNKKISGGRDSWTEAWNIQCIWDIVPLLTEGQLRQFIEDKTECKVIIESTYGYQEYYMYLFNKGNKVKQQFYKLGNGLLQAYWKAATQIAKEGV